jgi:ribosomal protein S18 acetylase RimI-like enzyme
MHSIRKANINDLDFIVKIDLEDEGLSTGNPWAKKSAETLKQHRLQMMQFIKKSLNTGTMEWDTCPKYALILTEKETKKRVGLIMFLFRDMNHPNFQHFGNFDKFPRTLFPPDGRFCEIAQLWIAPENRRRGLATRLKKKVEEICLKNNVLMIYTHMEATNNHVLAMNLKLGYQIIRTGPLGDGLIKTSLVKYLNLT